MPKLATSGMNTCAIISIGYFGGKEDNERFKSQYGTYRESTRQDIKNFLVTQIRTSLQVPSETNDYPFEEIMRCIECTDYFDDKVYMCTLNRYQYMKDDKYWHKELKRWRFRLVRKTKNDHHGVDNYIYMRIPGQIPLNGDQK